MHYLDPLPILKSNSPLSLKSAIPATRFNENGKKECSQRLQEKKDRVKSACRL